MIKTDMFADQVIQMFTAALAGVPEWADQRFDEFFEETNRSEDLVKVTMSGIAMIRQHPRIIEFLTESGLQPPDASDRLARARTAAALADEEVGRGFPVVHAHAAIALWGSLESVIEDLLVSALGNCSRYLQQPEFQRMRVRVAVYHALPDDEKYRYLLGELEQPRARYGAERFEEMLKPFGLSGPVASDVIRTLLELHQVRNVLVHRRGFADERLVRLCPWLGISEGQPVVVSSRDLARYLYHAADYAILVRVRIGCAALLGAFSDN